MNLHEIEAAIDKLKPDLLAYKDNANDEEYVNEQIALVKIQATHCHDANLTLKSIVVKEWRIILSYIGINPTKEVQIDFDDDGGIDTFEDGKFAGCFGYRAGPSEWKLWLDK